MTSRSRALLMVALLALVPAVAWAQIFEGSFELGDTCAWSATMPIPGSFCPDAHTVALWHFGRGQGQIVIDSTGSGRDFALGSSAAQEAVDPSWAPGRFGYGLFFESVYEEYCNSDGSNTFPTNELSVEMWVAPTGGTGTGGGGQVFTAGFIICEVTVKALSNSIQVGVGTGSMWSDFLTADAGSVDLDDGQWHYVAVTYDGSLLAAYADGAVLDSLISPLVLGSPGDYKVGGRPGNTFIDGWMDEVRLSDVARSPAEIAATWSQANAVP